MTGRNQNDETILSLIIKGKERIHHLGLSRKKRIKYFKELSNEFLDNRRITLIFTYPCDKGQLISSQPFDNNRLNISNNLQFCD